MSQRVIGYTGEGRARTPRYAVEEPAVARVTGLVIRVARRGYLVLESGLPDVALAAGDLAGDLVRGKSVAEQHRDDQRAHRARQRGAA